MSSLGTSLLFEFCDYRVVARSPDAPSSADANTGIANIDAMPPVRYVAFFIQFPGRNKLMLLLNTSAWICVTHEGR